MNNQLDITGYKVTTLKIIQASLQALEGQMQQMAAQRQELAATLWAEIRAEGEQQGVDVPEGANADIRQDRVVVTWQDAPTGGNDET